MAASQNNLGLMFEEGRGVAKNNATADVWLGKAAQQGHAVAQRNVEVIERSRTLNRLLDVLLFSVIAAAIVFLAVRFVGRQIAPATA